MTGIPSTETVWMTEVSPSGVTYAVTSKASRDKYFLYREENGKAVKIASAKNPMDFNDKMI